MIELDDVERASRRLAGAVRRTPVLTSASLNQMVGCEVFVKAESFQRSGSFKFRGAYHALAAMDPGRRRRGVITGSSGNHAAALALAARLWSTRAVVVMPQDAPASKRAATAGYGAEVVDYDRYGADRDAVVARLAAERGLTVVPAYDHDDVMAGQGTLALELFDEVGRLDALLVCVGGGGLIAGCATVAKGIDPAVTVIGVEPEAGDDHVRSFAAGRRVHLAAVPRSVADGQLVPAPGERTFEVNRQRVDRFVAVADDAIVAAMEVCFERLKVTAEPSGASALAALTSAAVDLQGARVGVTLSGGNIDALRFARLVGGVPGGATELAGSR